MDLHIKGKVILVTGGAKGIGEGIVLKLASEGAIPVIVGRNREDNQRVVNAVESLGGKAAHVVAELTSDVACRWAVDEACKVAGRIDGLVNNAGVNDGVGLTKGNYDGFMSSLHKNLVHYYLMAHYALPELIKSKGPIVNIGSKVARSLMLRNQLNRRDVCR